MWDSMTPVEEVMRGLDDLVRAGKVLYVGFSDSPAWVVAYAVALAERHGWVRPVAAQLPYSFASRDAERDVVPMARTLGLSVLAWGILEGGELTGKYNEDNDEPRRYDNVSAKAKQMATELRGVAAEIGRSPAQVAVNWVRQQPGVIPIVGARTVAQIEDNLGALDFTLTDKQLAHVGKLNEFRLGFPLSFLTDDHVRNLIFGNTFALIDHPYSVV
jgi:aryl-alcohol dehydrogenase-like predicted oxidoreductase